MDSIEDRVGRAALLRLESGRPLTALSPAWAGLCGLLVTGCMAWNAHTAIAVILLLLLVEPLMGGLWSAACAIWDGTTRHRPPPLLLEGQNADMGLASVGDWSHANPAPAAHRGMSLPYIRRGSAADRLLSGLSHLARDWRQGGEPRASFTLNLVFTLAIASVVGLTLPLMTIAVIVLAARLRWRAGIVAFGLGALYDLFLPWLMGMAAIGRLAEYGLERYWPVLLLAACYTLVYAACLAVANGARLSGLLVLDLTQAAVLAFLLTRQETLAVWLLGLGLIGQAWAHPPFVGGGTGRDYLRRVAPYIVLGMLAAAIALTPASPGT